MADFNIAFQITSAHEGAYSNHPKDTGGETYRGIARNKNPNWSGWSSIDQLKSKANFPDNLKNDVMLQQKVSVFFKQQYWDGLKLDSCNMQAIANKLYDIAVNMGTGIAAKMLQRVLNAFNQNQKYYPDLSIDGIVGNTTMSALNKHPKPYLIFKALNVLQGEHYFDIVEHNEAQEVFMNGWFEQRIAALVEPNNSSNIA